MPRPSGPSHKPKPIPRGRAGTPRRGRHPIQSPANTAAPAGHGVNPRPTQDGPAGGDARPSSDALDWFESE